VVAHLIYATAWKFQYVCAGNEPQEKLQMVREWCNRHCEGKYWLMYSDECEYHYIYFLNFNDATRYNRVFKVLPSAEKEE